MWLHDHSSYVASIGGSLDQGCIYPMWALLTLENSV